ncbi:MAG TPA: hypothetical protein VGM07_16255 [Stellaceae bacterium]|jgi:uncharacterized membrane protein YbaN (DUF454 family)
MKKSLLGASIFALLTVPAFAQDSQTQQNWNAFADQYGSFVQQFNAEHGTNLYVPPSHHTHATNCGYAWNGAEYVRIPCR